MMMAIQLLIMKKIKLIVENFFKNLFSVDNDFRYTKYLVKGYFPALGNIALEEIQAPVTHEEIKRVVFSMGAYKASALDGLQAAFFQSQWDMVDPSVFKFILNCFNNPTIIKSINNSVLVLIPQADDAESIKQYHPITLCNVVYKMIIQIIALRLKYYMDHLIAPNQCNFIPKGKVLTILLLHMKLFTP